MRGAAPDIEHRGGWLWQVGKQLLVQDERSDLALDSRVRSVDEWVCQNCPSIIGHIGMLSGTLGQLPVTSRDARLSQTTISPSRRAARTRPEWGSLVKMWASACAVSWRSI